MATDNSNINLNDSYYFTTSDLCKLVYSKLFQYQCSGTLCDVAFSNGVLSISAHSCILAVVSPFMMRYFLSHRNLYCSDGVCQSNIIVPISVITKMVNESGDNCMDCFSNVIKYIYTGRIKISKTHFQHIANMSCNLEIDELIVICQKYNNRTQLRISDNFIYDNVNDCGEDNFIGSSSLLAKSPKFSNHTKNTCLSVTNESYCKWKDKIQLGTNKTKNTFDSDSNSSADNLFKSVSNSNSSNSINPIFNCLYCKDSYNNVILSSQHKSIFHSNDFCCILCNFRANILHDIIKHLLKFSHGNKFCVCLKELPDSTASTSHEVTFPCDKCDANFKTKRLWEKHFIVHSDRKRNIFQCAHCSLTFTSRKGIKSHFSNKCKFKTCEMCGYTTKYASYLKRHLLKHRVKYIFCSYDGCNFQTCRKSSLKAHSKTHRRAKEFECSLCKTSFTLKRNLQRHMIIHSNPPLYKCPECEYKNNRFDKVKDHCRMHPESADIFDKLAEKYFKKKSVVLENCEKVAGGNEVSENPEAEYLTDEEISSNKVLYLNEMTGELSFICDSAGKPLKGVPDVITIHSIGNVKNADNFEGGKTCSAATDVILNEFTGELNYIQMNFESNATDVSSRLYSSTEVTVLDETTGEMTSKPELLSFEKENISFDFDSIDFDAMNDDSFDGFDDFDNALFDAEFSIGSASPDMDKILNEFTGELFTDESACKLLNKQIENESMHPLWRDVDLNVIQENNSQVQELAEIFLNEVTGELTAELSRINQRPNK